MIRRSNRKTSKIGQNFLVDGNTARFMCATADIRSDDRILEIGPGKGMLTRYILEAQPSRLYAVELDKRFFAELTALVEANPNLIITWEDALSVDYRTSFDPPPNKVVANIPYQITTDLVWKLVEEAAPSGSIYFILMVQKEAAERLCASPGTRRSNPLSVTLGKIATMEVLLTVPPSAFRPSPKVESALLQVRLEKPLFIKENPRWRIFVESAFRQRRKTLLNNFTASLRLEREQVITWFENCDLPLNRRAEELNIEQWDALYSFWLKYLRAAP